MSRLVHSRLFHFLILLALLVAAAYYSHSNHDLRKRLQYVVFDTFNQLHPRPPTDDVVIIDIDEASLEKLGQWPWPRSVMADLTTRLKSLGASAIAYDMVFAEPDRTSPSFVAARLPDTPAMAPVKEAMAGLPDNDDVFAQAIADAGNVVMGFVAADGAAHQRAPVMSRETRFLPPAKAAAMREAFLQQTGGRDNVATDLPILSEAAVGNGHFIAEPDVDGIIRKVALFMRYPRTLTAGQPAQLFPTLGVEAVRAAHNPKIENQILLKKPDEQKALDTLYKLRIGQKYDVPLEPDSRFWVYYRDIRDDEYVSAYKILDAQAQAAMMPKIDGKIAFVGTSAIGLKDIRSTPLDLFIPGVEVHVNVVEQILQGKFLMRPHLIAGAESLTILVSGLIIIVLAPFVNALLLGLFSVVTMAAGFALSWYAYVNAGLLLDPVYPGLAIGMIFLVSTLLTYVRTESDRRRVKNAFGHYISPDFMEELTKNPDKLVLGGETRDLTVMFTDIRNFTGISERMSPAALTQLMNDFLTPMSDLVMSNRGTIDKFMGDAMMAFWNAPLDDADHARHACLTALRMNEALRPINEKLKKEAQAQGQEPVALHAGIGLNTGPASVGNMGSRQRFAYSALGDNVNLASRLEGQTKSYGVEILISAATQRCVPELAALELDLLRVKGKSEPVRIYTLIGDEQIAQSEAFREWKDKHQRMLALYRGLDLDAARHALAEARTLSAGRIAGYYDMMEERIESLEKNRPNDSWDGVFTATTK